VRTVTALLTNKAYGYPTRGARRRRKPTILACLHQTANAKATAMQERNYANRVDSGGPSATAYIDRDGTIVRAIDPAKYAAWSQGDVAHPNIKLPTITAAVSSGVTSRATRTTVSAAAAPIRADEYTSARRRFAASSRSSPMPTTSVDPGVHEEREHEEVEGAAHQHAGEEGHDELEPVHRAPEGLTARTYPAGGTGTRPGSDQRAVMP
jgi:hypothetical protein